MKTSKFFKIGFVCVLVLVGIGTYLWYLYFHEYESEVLLTKNVRLEIINNGRTNYINAVPNDDENVIPVYYFRVKNYVDVPLSYEIYLQDVSPTEAGDGCSWETAFTRNDLDYELKLDNKVVSSGKLSELKKDVLDRQRLDGTDTLDYSLRIWVNKDVIHTLGRHYHYVVNIREIE